MPQRVVQLGRALLPKREDGRPTLGDLHYQLLTAAAGTLAFADDEDHPRDRAVLLIHDFRGAGADRGKLDGNRGALLAFLRRLGADPVDLAAGDDGSLPPLGPFKLPGTAASTSTSPSSSPTWSDPPTASRRLWGEDAESPA